MTRKNEWMNRLHPYKVLVDGMPVVNIANGTFEELEVGVANHSIECKIDWCYSNKYELKAADGNTFFYG